MQYREVAVILNPMSEQEAQPKSRFWTPTRLGLTAGALILVVGIGAAVYNPSTENDRRLPEERSAGPAKTPREIPEEVRQAKFTTLDGQQKTLADYAGKVVVLDLWATWCGPCRQEIPHLVKMADDYREKGVEVLGLTTEDPKMDGDLVREFSRSFSINYEIGFSSGRLSNEIMNGQNSIPQTLIIGRDGVIRKHFVGFHPRYSAPRMKAAVEELLAGN